MSKMAEMPPRNQFMQVSAAPHSRVKQQSLICFSALWSPGVQNSLRGEGDR